MLLLKQTPKPDDEYRRLQHFLANLYVSTPRQMVESLRQEGYVGQDNAVKATCLFAFRHISRLKKLYLHRIDPRLLPKKNNILFVGPTGCGKTYLVELLFQKVIKLPHVIVDMTGYSETGYVGQDVNSVLTRLLYAADMDPSLAAIGIVCLDEFDKLASSHNRAVFAGAGTTKDVSGLGVQRELLKLLESSDVPVPVELSHSDYAPRTVISTENISFIACGAFSGLKGHIGRLKGEYIGFGRTPLEKGIDAISVDYSDEEVEPVRNFQQFGFLPELIGRFDRIIPFHALGENELTQILKEKVSKRWAYEFGLHDIQFEIDEEVVRHIIKKSITRETGARGVEATCIRYIEDAAFEAYSSPGTKKIRLKMKNDEVEYELS